MAGITFRTRKYESCVDSSYTLYNGSEIGSVDHWHIGDIVSVMFDVPRHQSKAINYAGFADVRVVESLFGSTDIIHIPCKVIERRHAMSWRDVGKFQDVLGTSVTLEASSGRWEDVLLWIVLGEKPSWISEEA